MFVFRVVACMSYLSASVSIVHMTYGGRDGGGGGGGCAHER
jgi:hypothetical protein